MAMHSEAKSTDRRFQLGDAEQLNRPERIALLVIVSGLILIDLIGFFAAPDTNVLRTALSVVTTLTFALYIWSPLAATLTLGAVVALSLFAGSATAGLMAGAFAAALVLRLGTMPLIIGYFGGLLLLSAVYVYGFGLGDASPTSAALVLVIATVAGGLGLALRMAYARGHRLEHELAEQAEREKEAVLAERRWIAGELHDSIAHHLTVIAMHVQLIDDDAIRPTSQTAIQSSARKAMSDLRFVIQMAEEAPRGTGVPSGDLAAAIDEASEEFEATGHRVVCLGDPNDERIPRGAEIILARIVRESATNILKYAGPGEIRFLLELEAESVHFSIRSPLPETPRRELPSTGTGLNRMAERVMGVSGEFSAAPSGDAWLVSVRLPIAS